MKRLPTPTSPEALDAILALRKDTRRAEVLKPVSPLSLHLVFLLVALFVLGRPRLAEALPGVRTWDLLLLSLLGWALYSLRALSRKINAILAHLEEAR
ncbi:MAG: hypothetical protein ABSH53_07365 [Holophaga sp.]